MLAAPVQRRDVAFLVEDDLELALSVGADGLHLGADEPVRYRAARARLGAGRTVGIAAPAARHDAMVAAERGADYVAVSAAAMPAADFLELIGWWSELMTVPLVAGLATTPEQTAAWAGAGADFVALDPVLWAAADPAALLALHQRALDQAAARAHLISS